MTWAAVALGLRLAGVVDRIEGDQAVVCWDADHAAPLPLAVLPPVSEGLRIIVRVRAAPAGLAARTPSELESTAGPLHLPARLVPGRTYRLHFRTRPVRPPRRPPVASLPDVIDLSDAGTPPHSHRSSP